MDQFNRSGLQIRSQTVYSASYFVVQEGALGIND